MQLKPEQLETHLRKQLAPVYFISGDEPLRVMEASDAVREAARAQGYSEREVLSVEAGFDWGRLDSAAGSLSLFAERRLVDLRLPGGKPGDAGAKALRAWADQPPEDTLLLVTAGKETDQRREQRGAAGLTHGDLGHLRSLPLVRRRPGHSRSGPPVSRQRIRAAITRPEPRRSSP